MTGTRFTPTFTVAAPFRVLTIPLGPLGRAAHPAVRTGWARPATARDAAAHRLG